MPARSAPVFPATVAPEAVNDEIPLLAYAILFAPGRVAKNLEAVRRARGSRVTPNVWQLCLGVLRMWHRIAFRSETIGMSTSGAPRRTWRARALQVRPLRFPFLIAERAVAPLDLTGLASPPERLIRHVLGAHHDREEFLYDLEVLSCYPGALEDLACRVNAVVNGDASQSKRAEWLRDLVVYQGYHERLARALERVQREGIALPPELAGNPDYSFDAYLEWCAAQPETPARTLAALRAGRYSIASGRVDA